MRWPASCLALYVAVTVCLLVVGVSRILDAAIETCVPCPDGYVVLRAPGGTRVCIGVEDGRPVVGPKPCHFGEFQVGTIMTLVGLFMSVLPVCAYFDPPRRL